MNKHILNNCAEPLVAFGEYLGIKAEVWAEREELEKLTYFDSEFSCEKAASLTLNQILPLLDAYGSALVCRFLLDELVVLEIAPDLDDTALKKFRNQILSSPIVTLDIELDKSQLIGSLLGKVTSGCCFFLYLFPESLEHFLTSELKRLESLLWGVETVHKVILLVSNREIWLDGPFLAIIGGKQISDWYDTVLKEPPDIEKVQNMYRVCRDTLKWQESWLQHLTPLHLKVDGQFLSNDFIANALQVHLVNSIILYTADQTGGNVDKPKMSTYAGATQSVELMLADPIHHLGEEESAGIRSLVKMLEWAYESQWSADRLPLVQIGIAQALHAADPIVRYRLLILNATNIFEGLKWHWKAFIEGKLDTYVSEVRALEDYIADTTQAFANQIEAMIKSLSDTMLVAVGVLLGSFIAALFKDDFNPIIFLIGMLVYAVYVIVFPLSYNMLHQWQRYKALSNNFDKRQERFEARLHPDNVEQIVGTNVADSKRRFKRWFLATLLAYILVISLVIIAALWVPKFMKVTTLS